MENRKFDSGCAKRVAKAKKMTDSTYSVMKPDKGVPIKAWTKGVPVEEAAQKQLMSVALMPFI